MRILVLGGGSDQVALIAGLVRRRHQVWFVDYSDRPIAMSTPAEHLQVSTLDVAAVHAEAERLRIDRVVTACTDQSMLTVAEVSEGLGLPTPFSTALTKQLTDKVAMKERLRAGGVPTAAPVDSYVDQCALLSKGVPLVVKPADCHGSLGVTRVADVPALDRALDDAAKKSRTGRTIVERFLEGEEFSVDAFVVNGRARVLLVTTSDKLPGQDGFLISASRFSASQFDEMRKLLQSLIQGIVDAYVLPDGPMIVQLILTAGGFVVLEFSARIAGGGKHHLIRRIVGVDVMEDQLRALFDEKVVGCAGIKALVEYAAFDYVYCNPGIVERAVGVWELRNSGGVDRVVPFKRPGATVGDRRASRDRVMGYICTGGSMKVLTEKRERAIHQIQVLGLDGRDLRYRFGNSV